jgi:hypothetical protein
MRCKPAAWRESKRFAASTADPDSNRHCSGNWGLQPASWIPATGDSKQRLIHPGRQQAWRAWGAQNGGLCFLPASGQGGSARQQSEGLVRAARGHYEEAAALARKTGSVATLVKALSGLALLDQTHDHYYGMANSRIQEALRAAPSCPNRDCMQDALLN